MIKNKLYIISLLLILFSCNPIDENERLLEYQPAVAGDKKVLLEEFTGQRCPNCPAGAAEAVRLKENYGDKFIIIAVHAGGYATDTKFWTEAGETYRKKFFPEGEIAGYPGAMVDRAQFEGERVSYGPAGYQKVWAEWTKMRFAVPSYISLELASDYDAENSTVTITSKTKSTTLVENTKLLIILTESHIIAPQANGGSKYEHNHVLRGVVGDDEKNYWGQDIVITSDEELVNDFTYKLNPEWVAENMDIVGLVYDADTYEVLQVEEIALLNK